MFSLPLRGRVVAKRPGGRETLTATVYNQENATKISATTATSTVRVMKVSMAAVPNEA